MRDSAEAEFDVIFDDVRLLAYRAAFRLLGQAAEAEDVAAETLARVYSRWPKVAAHVRPWAITVATNLALGRGRRLATADKNRHAVARTDTQPDPHLEERFDLQAALRALPERQREVITLRFLADWSVAATPLLSDLEHSFCACPPEKARPAGRVAALFPEPVR
jgi:RNA polymerase sigma factor (sigma-70 family)